MSNRRMVIAGCGYVGKRLARRLMGTGHEISGLVSSAASLQACTAQGIECTALDFDDKDALQAASLEMGDSRLIYLAPPPPRGDQDTRLGHLLQRIAGQSIQRMVLISTTGVYGDCAGEWVDESRTLNPQVDRALRRADAEQRACIFCERYGIPLVILRVPGIYGPGKLPLERIKKGTPIVSEQDSPFTNRIHVQDLVNICEQALLRDDIAGVYNCSDGRPGTMYEYFTRVAEFAGLPQPPAISLQQAQDQLSAGMLSYMNESRRIDNRKLLRDFAIQLDYPDLPSGLRASLDDSSPD